MAPTINKTPPPRAKCFAGCCVAGWALPLPRTHARGADQVQPPVLAEEHPADVSVQKRSWTSRLGRLLSILTRRSVDTGGPLLPLRHQKAGQHRHRCGNFHLPEAKSAIDAALAKTKNPFWFTKRAPSKPIAKPRCHAGSRSRKAANIDPKSIF